ncbi:MAG: SPOR domain-containing protein [candidate division WOR-3 bacterium]
MPFFLLLFSTLMVQDNQIFKIDPENLCYADLTLPEEILDYSLDGYLYILTSRHILSIDTTDLRIIDRTPLPQCFNYLALGKEEVFLIATSEIVKLARVSLAFKGGIGIESGLHEPMVAPGMVPGANLLYLIDHTEKKSIIRIFDLDRGKKLSTASFPRIIDFQYLPEKKCFVTIDSSSLTLLDLKLKTIKKLKLLFTGEKISITRYGYIITNHQGIFYLDSTGKLIDFQPVCLDGVVQNTDFIFLNEKSIVWIEPRTLRITKVIAHPGKIKAIQKLDDFYYFALLEDLKPMLFELSPPGLKYLKKKKLTPQAREESLTSPDSLLYYIQFNAFTEKTKAANYADSLRLLGLPVLIDSTPPGLFRVQLGGFATKSAAREMAEKIDLPSWIVHHQNLSHVIDTLFVYNDQTFVIKNGIISRKE